MTIQIQILRLPCGTYVTPDLRFSAVRAISERGTRCGWWITDEDGKHTFDSPVRTLADVEAAIATALSR